MSVLKRRKRDDLIEELCGNGTAGWHYAGKDRMGRHVYVNLYLLETDPDGYALWPDDFNPDDHFHTYSDCSIRIREEQMADAGFMAKEKTH